MPSSVVFEAAVCSGLLITSVCGEDGEDSEEDKKDEEAEEKTETSSPKKPSDAEMITRIFTWAQGLPIDADALGIRQLCERLELLPADKVPSESASAAASTSRAKSEEVIVTPCESPSSSSSKPRSQIEHVRRHSSVTGAVIAPKGSNTSLAARYRNRTPAINSNRSSLRTSIEYTSGSSGKSHHSDRRLSAPGTQYVSTQVNAARPLKHVPSNLSSASVINQQVSVTEAMLEAELRKNFDIDNMPLSQYRQYMAWQHQHFIAVNKSRPLAATYDPRIIPPRSYGPLIVAEEKDFRTPSSHDARKDSINRMLWEKDFAGMQHERMAPAFVEEERKRMIDEHRRQQHQQLLREQQKLVSDSMQYAMMRGGHLNGAMAKVRTQMQGQAYCKPLSKKTD